MLIQEMVDEERDVVRTLAQRRHADRNHCQAVIQIVAKRAVRDHLLEVPVGRRDDANVHLNRTGLADLVDLALLQHPKDLHLKQHRQLADLVEKDGSAVGGFELPALVADRAGERSPLVAEQFGLEQLFRNGAAIDRHERRPRA